MDMLHTKVEVSFLLGDIDRYDESKDISKSTSSDDM